MTTAATPQDSPISTLAHGASFSDWENNCLKPPSVMGSVKALNNLLVPEPYPLKRKLSDNSNSQRTPITPTEFEVNASISNIKLSPSASERMRAETTYEPANGKSRTGHKQSLKKRSSGKRRPRRCGSQDCDGDQCDRVSVGAINPEAPRRQSKRGQNNARNTNKVCPQSKRVEDTNGCYNNYLEQQPDAPRESLTCGRRMSTMDPQALRKLANLDIQQLEVLRERAQRRDAKEKGEPDPTATKRKPESPKLGKNFGSNPLRYTKAIVRKHFEHLTEGRDNHSLYIFSETNQFRRMCHAFITKKWFDNVILLFIALNCITLAMERPNIPPNCAERYFLMTANYVFTFVFTTEMFIKVSGALMTGMREVKETNEPLWFSDVLCYINFSHVKMICLTFVFATTAVVVVVVNIITQCVLSGEFSH